MPYVIPSSRSSVHRRRRRRKRANTISSAKKNPHRRAPADAAAVVVGIEYTNYARKRIEGRLPGCHRDAMNVRQMLIKRFNVSPRRILMLADDGKRGHRPPTKSRIVRGLRNLVNSKRRMLWFTYSGHGGSVRDTNGDELDGRDETLVPADYRSAGQLRDDSIAAILSRVRPGASFFGLFDSCHSGSVADLPTSYRAQRGAGSRVSIAGPLRSGNMTGQIEQQHAAENPARIVTISACRDDQTAASAHNLEGRRKWQGAMTNAFRALPIKGGRSLSGDQVLQLMQDKLNRRRFAQMTTLSTNDSISTSAETVIVPHP